MKNLLKKIKRPRLFGCVCFIVCFQVLLFSGYVSLPKILYFNRTPSLPVGIYCEIPWSPVEKGDLVLVEVPQEIRALVEEREWMKGNELLLKKVGALEGDRFMINEQRIEVNGNYIGPIYDVDSQKRPMPVLRGEFQVPEGYFLPIATNVPNSFDGRYFGSVPLTSIKTKVILLVSL